MKIDRFQRTNIVISKIGCLWVGSVNPLRVHSPNIVAKSSRFCGIRTTWSWSRCAILVAKQEHLQCSERTFSCLKLLPTKKQTKLRCVCDSDCSMQTVPFTNSSQCQTVNCFNSTVYNMDNMGLGTTILQCEVVYKSVVAHNRQRPKQSALAFLV